MNVFRHLLGSIGRRLIVLEKTIAGELIRGEPQIKPPPQALSNKESVRLRHKPSENRSV